MLKIYGNNMSGHSNKVRYVAELLGMENEFKNMDFHKDLKTPEFLKVHPAGKIPAIDDDGFILFESSTICRYLCDKKGSELYPKGLKERFIVDQWVDFCSIHIDNAMGKVAFNRVFAPQMGMEVDQNSLNEGMKFLDRFLPIINDQLKKSKFIASEKLSLADITFLSVMDYAEMAQVDISKYESISRWKKEIDGMEFVKKVKGNK
jgi:glutathione S-transferase